MKNPEAAAQTLAEIGRVLTDGFTTPDTTMAQAAANLGLTMEEVAEKVKANIAARQRPGATIHAFPGSR